MHPRRRSVRPRGSRFVFLALFGLASTAAPALAADVGIAAKKLVVVDTLAAKGKAKAVFVAKDPAIDKGAGTDLATISAVLQMSYVGGSADGAFVLPLGDAGWILNDTDKAAFKNPDAPEGSTQTKVSKIRNGKLVTLVARGLGETPFDILSAGAPVGTVHTAYCVENDGAETCFCSVFSDCDYKPVAGDTGAKLVCKAGASDAGCLGRCAGQTCPVYEWVTGPPSSCSTTCGDGTQTRVVLCRETVSSTVVADSFCAESGPKPASQQSCNLGPCPTYDWETGSFSPCSVTCGGGTQVRTVQCVEQNSMTVVSDSFCAGAGTKPASSQVCNTQACVNYEWETGSFGSCSTSCGDGTQTRIVQCRETISNTVVSDSLCSGSGPKPATQQSCNLGPCPTYDWETGSFSPCSVTCGGGTQVRTVQCVEQNSMTVVSDSFCAGAGTKPASSQACNTSPCP